MKIKDKVYRKVGKRFLKCTFKKAYPEVKAVKVMYLGEEWIIKESEVFTLAQVEAERKKAIIANRLERRKRALQKFVEAYHSGARTYRQFAEMLKLASTKIAAGGVLSCVRLGLFTLDLKAARSKSTKSVLPETTMQAAA